MTSRLVVNLLVTTVLLPLALPPVLLEVLHLITVKRNRVVAQRILQTALAALAQAEEDEGSDTKSGGGGSANVDSNVGSLAEIIPFLRKGLLRRLV